MKILTIEIAYASDREQGLHTLQIAQFSTVRDALQQSPVEWQGHAIGIYSRLTTLDTPLTSDCRIEIYQPLKIDPKQARRRRARQ